MPVLFNVTRYVKTNNTELRKGEHFIGFKNSINFFLFLAPKIFLAQHPVTTLEHSKL